MYQPTTAFRKIASLRKRIRAVSGGTGAAKTVSILEWLIDYAQTHPDEVIDVTSESYPHLDLGAIAEFKRIMTSHGYWEDDRWNGGAPRSYMFETGTIMQFVSFDSVTKAHGPRRDVLFVNEANNMSWMIIQQLMARTRKIIWFDWNPSEDFWFEEEILGKRDDVDFMGDGGNLPPLTYLDNEGYDIGQLNELLSRKNDEGYWRVYGLGLKGKLVNRIYSDWKIIEEVPHEARLSRYAVDFGYSEDPAAILAIYEYNGGYIVDELAYETFMDNKDIADVIKSQKDKAITIADSAEPKSIADIREQKVLILPAVKGPDSVDYGIKLVQKKKISVTKRSVNTIKEYRKYLWIVDKNGKIVSDPDPRCEDHSMDALRYGIVSLHPKKAKKSTYEQKSHESPMPYDEGTPLKSPDDLPMRAPASWSPPKSRFQQGGYESSAPFTGP